MRLAIITTHPIQYYAPLFKLLTDRGNIELKVFYTWGEKALEKFDPGFKKVINWDIPLLEGYPYEWMKNTSTNPGSHHSKGIINPYLNERIEKWRADAILVFGWMYHSHLGAIKYFHNKIPVYFRGDSTLLDKSNSIREIIKTIFLRKIYSYVSAAFYTGTNNKVYFKKYGLKDKQLIFAPHAVDNDRFANNTKDEALTIRTKLNIDDDEIVIIYSGKLEPKKAPTLLLDAFLELKIPKTHLIFIGDGILEQNLKNKATGHKNIHFMGFQNQFIMPQLLQACNIFCLPSYGPGETWGLAINEAMACGKAVIVSDKCGCAIDLVKENGLIFEHGNLKQLKSALNHIIANKLWIPMGKKSMEIIKDFNFTSIACAIENKVNGF